MRLSRWSEVLMVHTCYHWNMICSSVQEWCIREQSNLFGCSISISMAYHNVVNPGWARWCEGCGTQSGCPSVECNQLKIIHQLWQCGWISMLRSQLLSSGCHIVSLSYQSGYHGQWAIKVPKNTQRITLRNLLQELDHGTPNLFPASFLNNCCVPSVLVYANDIKRPGM